MTVHCPHCLTGYELPPELLGEHGARVRCPGCQGVFTVLPEESARGESAPGPTGTASGEAMSGGDSAPAAPAAPPATGEVRAAASETPEAAAGAVLEVLVDFLGDDLARSRARGTVLSDHGPAIMAVWQEYRRRAGDDAPNAAFRAALRERCGVDLG